MGARIAPLSSTIGPRTPISKRLVSRFKDKELLSEVNVISWNSLIYIYIYILIQWNKLKSHNLKIYIQTKEVHKCLDFKRWDVNPIIYKIIFNKCFTQTHGRSLSNLIVFLRRKVNLIRVCIAFKFLIFFYCWLRGLLCLDLFEVE